ncbi:DUF4247 domain-containing protein [Brevibacillus fulvus]|uniref:DUF4247 domain-containing protein n=1 Tax=Brevibacillus fulvus TaxID=1125967 RepID=A0A938XX38_9BACL|nr:DUF4247 domain-containing protein [Brevibacillus fulvus]MBM7592088.1 hypothetical protein [Brevibacillus fulvus]
MGNRWSAVIKSFLTMALFVSILSGCGSNNSVASNYPLEQVTQNGGQVSRVYRAENQSVPEVAKILAAENKPNEISKEDPDHMFLIYDDEWYHLQKDSSKPADTLIEVDSKQFVQQNYDSSFLQGYILASLLDDLFDSRGTSTGKYRGYSSKDIYKPDVVYHQPTAAEKKTYPPVTKEGKGSIIKRSSTSAASSKWFGNTDSSSSTNRTTSSSTGKIIKSSESSSGKSSSSIFSRPKSNSPPKTIFKRSGRITKRR